MGMKESKKGMRQGKMRKYPVSLEGRKVKKHKSKNKEKKNIVSNNNQRILCENYIVIKCAFYANRTGIYNFIIICVTMRTPFRPLVISIKELFRP